jgi:hypothetical protein
LGKVFPYHLAQVERRKVMDPALPNLDREALRETLRAEFERTLEQVADAVDKAAVGRVIRDSEEPARDALDHLRQVVFERAIQLKVDAAQAAFPPSEPSQRGPAAE